MDILIMIRLWIVFLGWPILIVGGIYALYGSFRFNQRIRENSLGKLLLSMNVGILVTMYCLGLISTSFLYTDIKNAVPVILLVFFIWVIVIAWVITQASHSANDAVILNERMHRTRQELEKAVQRRTRELEEALAHNEALLRSIGDGLIAADLDLKIVLVNPAAENMLGWSSNEIVGRMLGADPKIVDEQGKTIPTKQLPPVVALTSEKKVEMDTASKRTFFYERKDGTRFPIGITATPILIKNKVTGVIVLFRDLSLEKQLDRAKTEFISLASHQLKTPPLAIKWGAENLLSNSYGALKADQRSAIQDMSDISEKMIETVNALLNVSRLELGTFIANPVPVDFAQVSQEILKELSPMITQKNMRITETYDAKTPQIPADPGLSKIIVENLVSNAVKYTPEHGSINISIAPLAKKQGIQICVQDSGLGIPVKDQPHIFEKMYRAENVRSESDGTGLGLYLLKAIVEWAHGRVWFESAEGTGTTFYVELPLSGMERREGTSHLG